MHRTVYLDLYWCLNFCLDYGILTLEQRILQRKTERFGILRGSLLGSTGSIILLWMETAGWKTMMAGVCLALLMQMISFPERRIGKLAEQMAVCFGMGFLLSGMLSFFREHTWAGFLFQYRIQPEERGISGMADRQTLLWILFSFLQVLLSSGAVMVGTGWLEKKRRQPVKMLIPVKLIYGEWEKQVIGLWDTGNLLLDPISGQGVHILSRDMLGYLGRIPVSEVRWIPYRSVGKSSGVLPAVFLDCMIVGENCRLEKPLVAISRHSLSGNGRYQMILYVQDLYS
ncbi:MAG: sigma-E processing peptidase SpoIIGA [Clostridiales bacterium]|nr:sigma-E processing peptidase SpoIIGA [Clostridiales bacterium]